MLLCITMQKKLSICLFTKDNTLKRMFMHNNNNNNAFGCSVYYSMIVNSSSSVSIFGIILCTSFSLLSYFAILYPYSIWCIAKSKSPNIRYLATAVVTLLTIYNGWSSFLSTFTLQKKNHILNMLDMYIVKANAVTS